MVSSQNPNWPMILAEFGLQSNPNYGSSLAFFTDITPRMSSSWSAYHGLQYELDQVQAGELHATWLNKDGALGPSNGSSVYGGQILPYRPYRIRAQYPPTINMLTADQASGGEGTPVAAGLLAEPNSMLLNWTGPSTSGGISVVASGTAFQGTQVFQNTMTSTAVTGQWPFQFTLSAQFGVQYTFSAYARCLTAGQSPTVDIAASWYTAGGSLISTSTGSTSVLTGGAAPAWTRLALTATAPSTAAYVLVGLALGSNLVANTIFQMDGGQWEMNGSASSWVMPSTWYGIHNGLVERYPQSWTYGGTYSNIQPISVDAFALLSQTILPDQFNLNILSPLGGAAPTFYYPFHEPSGTTHFADSMGLRNATSNLDSSNGAGTITAGASRSSATPTGIFLGSPGKPVVNISSPGFLRVSSGQLPLTGPMSVISIPGAPPAGVVQGPANGTGLGFTRMIAFRQSTDFPGQFPTDADLSQQVWAASQVALFGAEPFIGIACGNGRAGAFIKDNTSVGMGWPAAFFPANPGDWHLGWVGVAANGLSAIGGVDNQINTQTYGSPLNFSFGFLSDTVGGAATASGQGNQDYMNNMIGDVAFAVEWPYLLSAAQINQLYSCWRDAFSGESSGQRYSRILALAGYLGASSVDTGGTTQMGPASVDGQDALTALQGVVTTERGTHWVDGNGVVTFRARTRRYNSGSPVVTFGTNGIGSGEVPLSMLTFDFDPTKLSNNITVTNEYSKISYTANDLTSQANYGVRSLSGNNNAFNTLESADAAAYLLATYKDPHMRVSAARVNVAANPALFPSMLGLEIGQLTRVIHRAPGAPNVQVDGWIEKVTHTADDKGAWDTDVEISPVDTNPYGMFASLHTTLSAAVSSGSGTVTINALPDAATNPVRANLTAGQKLVMDVGLATQETVTIAVGGVPVTSPGYTTAVITLTANLTQNHLINAVVCEPLPSGVTNPAFNDAVAVFGTSLFAY